MDKSKLWRLLLYVSLLLALGGIVGHVAGDAICAAQGVGVSVACEANGDSGTAYRIAPDVSLHGGFALPASMAWTGRRILVFLVLVFSFPPMLFSLLPSPPPPRRIP